VTTLEPVRAKNGVTTLHLRVVGPHDLGVQMVRNMEDSRRFLHPRIVGENAESAGTGPNQAFQPVSDTNRFDFDILTEYNPPSPQERAAEKTGKAEARRAPQTAPQVHAAPAAPPSTAPHPSAGRRPRLQTNPAPQQQHPVPGRLMSPFSRSNQSGGAR
jgi:type IV pilus assembly protein PilN